MKYVQVCVYDFFFVNYQAMTECLQNYGYLHNKNGGLFFSSKQNILNDDFGDGKFLSKML